MRVLAALLIFHSALCFITSPTPSFTHTRPKTSCNLVDLHTSLPLVAELGAFGLLVPTILDIKEKSDGRVNSNELTTKLEKEIEEEIRKKEEKAKVAAQEKEAARQVRLAKIAENIEKQREEEERIRKNQERAVEIAREKALKMQEKEEEAEREKAKA